MRLFLWFSNTVSINQNCIKENKQKWSKIPPFLSPKITNSLALARKIWTNCLHSRLTFEQDSCRAHHYFRSGGQSPNVFITPGEPIKIHFPVFHSFPPHIFVCPKSLNRGQKSSSKDWNFAFIHVGGPHFIVMDAHYPNNPIFAWKLLKR